jgi:hypothetical protein
VVLLFVVLVLVGMTISFVHAYTLPGTDPRSAIDERTPWKPPAASHEGTLNEQLGAGRLAPDLAASEEVPALGGSPAFEVAGI